MIACHVIRFRREENKPGESGLAVVTAPGVSDVITIVDAGGNVVPLPVWNYSPQTALGSIVLVE